MSNPADLKDIAKVMKEAGIPYSIAVYPLLCRTGRGRTSEDCPARGASPSGASNR